MSGRAGLMMPLALVLLWAEFRLLDWLLTRPDEPSPVTFVLEPAPAVRSCAGAESGTPSSGALTDPAFPLSRLRFRARRQTASAATSDTHPDRFDVADTFPRSRFLDGLEPGTRGIEPGACRAVPDGPGTEARPELTRRHRARRCLLRLTERDSSGRSAAAGFWPARWAARRRADRHSRLVSDTPNAHRPARAEQPRGDPSRDPLRDEGTRADFAMYRATQLILDQEPPGPDLGPSATQRRWPGPGEGPERPRPLACRRSWSPTTPRPRRSCVSP